MWSAVLGSLRALLWFNLELIVFSFPETIWLGNLNCPWNKPLGWTRKQGVVFDECCLPPGALEESDCMGQQRCVFLSPPYLAPEQELTGPVACCPVLPLLAMDGALPWPVFCDPEVSSVPWKGEGGKVCAGFPDRGWCSAFEEGSGCGLPVGECACMFPHPHPPHTQNRHNHGSCSLGDGDNLFCTVSKRPDWSPLPVPLVTKGPGLKPQDSLVFLAQCSAARQERKGRAPTVLALRRAQSGFCRLSQSVCGLCRNRCVFLRRWGVRSQMEGAAQSSEIRSVHGHS